MTLYMSVGVTNYRSFLTIQYYVFLSITNDYYMNFIIIKVL